LQGKHFRNLILLALLASCPMFPQSISSGTVTGAVSDPSGALVSDAIVHLRNSVTGYEQSAKTDNAGVFRFNNVPQNPYQLTAKGSLLRAGRWVCGAHCPLA